MDHPELRRITQPSTMGGPLGEPGFCIFRSTVDRIIMALNCYDEMANLLHTTHNTLPHI